MTDRRDPSFEFITKLQAAKSRTEDFVRLQDSIALRETGYANRHERSGKRDSRLSGKRMNNGLTALDLLLQDATYADTYQRFGERLSELETATEDALVVAQRMLAQIMERAVQLPGVGPVFLSVDGLVFDKHGNEIEPEQANGIIWPDGVPSYEEYRRQKRSVEALETYRTDVLGGYRDRLEDEDNPMTADELDEALEELDMRKPESLASVSASEIETNAIERRLDPQPDMPAL